VARDDRAPTASSRRDAASQVPITGTAGRKAPIPRARMRVGAREKQSTATDAAARVESAVATARGQTAAAQWDASGAARTAGGAGAQGTRLNTAPIARRPAPVRPSRLYVLSFTPAKVWLCKHFQGGRGGRAMPWALAAVPRVLWADGPASWIRCAPAMALRADISPDEGSQGLRGAVQCRLAWVAAKGGVERASADREKGPVGSDADNLDIYGKRGTFWKDGAGRRRKPRATAQQADRASQVSGQQ